MKTTLSTEAIQTDVLEKIKYDSEQARLYLNKGFNAYREDKKVEPFLLMLRTFVEANGGLDLIAKKGGVDSGKLSRALLGEHSPDIIVITAILRGTGYYISFTKKKKSPE